MNERRHSFSSLDSCKWEWIHNKKMKLPAQFESSFKCNSSKIRVFQQPLWNSSTKIDKMTNSMGSLDSFSVLIGETSVGAPIKTFENNNSNAVNNNNISGNNNNTKRIDKNDLNVTEIISGVKIYDIWRKNISNDQISSELAWNRCRKLANEALDSFCDRLALLENLVSDDVARVCLLDLNAVAEKKKEIEAGIFEIEDHDIEFRQVSKVFQNVAQYLPPSQQREEAKSKISKVRKRYFNVLEALSRKKEIFRWFLPLLQQYKVLGSDIKNWLDATEVRSELFITHFNNHALILENEEAIENIYEELCVQKDVYENFLEAGEGILDLHKEEEITELKQDLDDVIIRWDTMCSNMEKCLNRLHLAKKIGENNKKNDTEKIEMQIRSEAQLCTCHKPFQIIKVGDGKYTFGTSKIVRLLRIHGSCIVVRVGGGWEYLYDFLLKTDPCRAKQLARTTNKGVHTLNLSGLDLTPLDKKGSEFSISVQRISQTWSPYRNRHDISGSLGSAASSDNVDVCDESSESLSLSTSTGSSTPLRSGSRNNFRNNSISRQTPLFRKYSCGSKLSASTDNINKKTQNRRLSLIERQTEYAERKKLSRALTSDDPTK